MTIFQILDEHNRNVIPEFSPCPNQIFLISSVMAKLNGIEFFSPVSIAILPFEPQRFKLTYQVWVFFRGKISQEYLSSNYRYNISTNED